MAGRIKVVFASLLKPVDEPRMYSKLGRSLAQTYKYDVNIIGFKSKNLCNDPLIRCWPIFDFPRISLSRALAPLKFFRKLLQLKPQLLILNSPDFLVVSSLYKILFGCAIIYDLQENYYRNIIWSHDTPSLLRRLRAGLIRAKESVFDRMIVRYILAEGCYLTECSFINKPFIILENKAQKPTVPPAHVPLEKQNPSGCHLLFAGTIAESYGIFDTFKVADAIQALKPEVQYTICGHCPSAATYDSLVREAEKRPWVQLLVDTSPIPHQQILQQLRAADYTFVAYRLNPANKDCKPTRIWEALAWKTPVILRTEHPWRPWIEQHQAGFAIDFNSPDPQNLLLSLNEERYFTKELPESIYWESIEEDWIAFVHELFHQ